MSPSTLISSCKNFLSHVIQPEYQLDSKFFKTEQGELTLKQHNRLIRDKKDKFCKLSFYCKGNEEKRKTDKRIFTDSFSNYQYQYHFRSNDLDKNKAFSGFSLFSTIGVYIASIEDEVIYVGDTNRSLYTRINDFANGLNFGAGHACANKICWLKYENYLTSLMQKNRAFIRCENQMTSFYNEIKISRWYSNSKLIKKLIAAKTINISFLMFPKPSVKYDLQSRRIISLLETHAILTCIREDGKNTLPLNYD